MSGDIETVVRIRPTGRDPLGDPLPGIPDEIDIEGCMFAPGPSRELGLGAQQATTDGTVYAPPDVDVRATDRLRVRGQTYSVVGDPQDWGSSGIVIPVRKTE